MTSIQIAPLEAAGLAGNSGRRETSRERSGRIGGMSEAHYVTRDELRAELAEMKVDLIKWMVGTGLGIATVTATLAGVILRSLQ